MSAWPAGLAEAYAACEQLARSHYENFPVASRLLPAPMRPHIAAVYAFARVADDIADEGTTPPDERRAQLRGWQERLHDAARQRDGAPPSLPASNRSPAGACHDHPAAARDRGGPNSRDELILTAVGHSIRALDLPIVLFDDLVSAFGQDTMTTRYASWSDVLDYCRRSANPIGRLVLRIAGYHDEAIHRSSDALCTALQLTNFWQDFGRDWQAGRLYVPADVMRACGSHEHELRNSPLSESWVRTMSACVDVTRQHFADGRAVCDAVRGRLRLELRLTWLGGLRVLDRIERRRFDVLGHRPALGAADVPALVCRALWWHGQAAEARGNA